MICCINVPDTHLLLQSFRRTLSSWLLCQTFGFLGQSLCLQVWNRRHIWLIWLPNWINKTQYNLLDRIDLDSGATKWQCTSLLSQLTPCYQLLKAQFTVSDKKMTITEIILTNQRTEEALRIWTSEIGIEAR